MSQGVRPPETDLNRIVWLVAQERPHRTREQTMSQGGDIKVTLTAVDHVSPALRRIGRRLWWMHYGGFVTTGLVMAVVVLTAIAAFLLGRLSV